MRIPYLDIGMEKRMRWVEDNTLRQHCFDEFFATIEKSEILNPNMLQRLRDLLNGQADGRVARNVS